eukprot:6205514-Pleurochrysis_carterae.AAC.2
MRFSREKWTLTRLTATEAAMLQVGLSKGIRKRASPRVKPMGWGGGTIAWKKLTWQVLDLEFWMRRSAKALPWDGGIAAGIRMRVRAAQEGCIHGCPSGKRPRHSKLQGHSSRFGVALDPLAGLQLVDQLLAVLLLEKSACRLCTTARTARACMRWLAAAHTLRRPLDVRSAPISAALTLDRKRCSASCAQRASSRRLLLCVQCRAARESVMRSEMQG